MKKISFLFFLVLLATGAMAQITITSADMPVVHDTLRYSTASPTSSINLNDTGANVTWDFHTLNPLKQAVDTYKTAASVNASYALTISTSAYGYKVADSAPGLSTSGLPVSVSDVYTFFNIKSSPSRYIAEAFAAKVSSIPTPANYSKPDIIYTFPLDYHNADSNSYSLTVSIPLLGSLKQDGYRKNRVDAWGTITTPYLTTATNCIRVRSEVHEIDSVKSSSLGIDMAIPRDFIEYKWLVNGEHYPALDVVENITGGRSRVSSVTYRDRARSGVSVTNVKPSILELTAYPNPATNGVMHLDIPANWNNYYVEVFDMQGKVVSTYENTSVLNIVSLANGKYVVRVTSGNSAGYTSFVK